MKTKLIIFFLLVFFQIFPNTFVINGEKVELNIIQKENYKYISTENLKFFHLNIQEDKEKIRAYNKEIEVEFYKNSQNIKINDIDIKLTNINISEEKSYVDFDFILYLLEYDIDGNIINKIEKRELPLEKNSFVVEKEAKKIISLSPGATEKLAGIGAINYIKARSEYDEYNEQIKNTVNIGSMFSPKLETIINLDPDIAIAETHYDPILIKKLKEAGIEIYYSPYPNKVENIYDFVLDMGLITGKYYEARGVVASMINIINRCSYILRDNKEEPRVYYVVGTGSVEYTAGKDTFISDLIKKAGGINIGDNVKGWVYSAEKLIDSNPDFIFGGKTNIDYMINHDIYQGLKAFRTKNYFYIDENIYNLSGISLITIGLPQLVEKLYGEKKAEELNFYDKK